MFYVNNKQRLKRLISYLSSQYFLLGLFLLCVLIYEINFIGFSISQKIPFGIVDDSLFLETIVRFMNGNIAGRDYIFNYGPLFQLLISAPSFVLGAIPHVGLLFKSTIFTLLSLITLWYIFSYQTKSHIINVFSLLAISYLFLGLRSFDSLFALRSLIPLAFLFMIDQVSTRNRIPTIHLIFLSVLPSVFGLLTYELFVYCYIILIIFVFGSFLTKRNALNIKKSIFVLILAAFTHVAISFFLSGGIQYMSESIYLSAQYTKTGNIAGGMKENVHIMLLPILAILTSTVMAYKHRNMLHLFIAAAIILATKSMFVRSDVLHIVAASFVSSAVLAKNIATLFSAKTAIFVMLLFIWIHPFHLKFIPLDSNNYRIVYRAIADQWPFTSIYSSHKDSEFKEDVFEEIKSLLINSSKDVFIYPYNTVYMNLLNLHTKTYLPQLFVDSGGMIESKTIKLLNMNKPDIIIIFPNNNIDNISNDVRNPLFFEFLNQHYIITEQKKGLVEYLVYEIDKPAAKKKCGLVKLEMNKGQTNDFNNIVLSMYATFVKQPLRKIITQNGEFKLVSGTSDEIILPKYFVSRIGNTILIQENFYLFDTQIFSRKRNVVRMTEKCINSTYN